MSSMPEGQAIVYCEAALATPNGKTAHGLIRFTRRYEVLAVIDSTCAGRDAGEVIGGSACGIPVVANLTDAVQPAENNGGRVTHFVIGLAPDGGRLPPSARDHVAEAIRHGLNVDSGLHDFLGDDPTLAALAKEHGVTIRDVRKPPSRDELHFFEGKIEAVESYTIAVLGTDSAIGKRTSATLLVKGLEALGLRVELIGTGQTAWMQGVRYGIVLDSLINDFVSGEIEHAVWRAWSEVRPDVILLEGQGSLLNPAYPGGFELLAAGRPDGVVLQHAPARKEYDGFPGYPLHPLRQQIDAIELISGKPVIAITLNHEHLDGPAMQSAQDKIRTETGLPVFDLLVDGPDALAQVILNQLPQRTSGR